MSETVSKLSPDKMTYQLAGKSKIVLNSADRLDLQKYVLQGSTLPATEESLKVAFNIPDSAIAEFQDMLKAYTDINAHCRTFYSGAFTQSISIASNIVDFGLSAKYYLTGISKASDDFAAGKISEEAAQEQCGALIDLLLKNIGDYVTSCDQVCAGINTFLVETQNDNAVLNGPDGESGLNKTYRDKYQLNDKDIKALQDDIQSATTELATATKDYNYDVTVAATSPTYAWIIPFGLIPAIVVAGVYGKRATEAYNKMLECRERITKETGELQKKQVMAVSLFCASNSISYIAELIKKAIGPIEAMKGCWLSIFDDLTALKKTVDSDIRTLPMLVKTMGVEKAVEEWDIIAKEADDYRKTAFISTTSATLVKAGLIQLPVPKRAA